MWFSRLYGICVRHHALLRQAVAAGLGALCLSGCMAWQTVQQRPGELLARHPRTTVRAVFHDGGYLTLYRPFIRSDSLGGGTDSTKPDALPVMVALKDVQHLEILQISAGRTLLAVAAVGATAALVVGIANDLSNLSAPRPSASSTNIKISCPLVYSWDGRHWHLDSGTFGGAIAEALQRTDVDNLDFARAEDGVLRLRVANELAETDHLDGLAALAVDHESWLTVAPDPSGGLHTIGTLVPPFRATDDRGVDALPRVSAADGWNWESTVSGRDPRNPADLRSGLELAFARPRGATRAHLVVDANSSPWGTYMLEEFIRAHGRTTQAWYDSMNAHPQMALAVQARLAREAFLAVSVRAATGWQSEGLLWEAGPEIVKRQVLDLDLSQVTGDTVLVRLTSAPSFWTIDHVALDFTADREMTVHELPLVSARDPRGRDVAPLIAAVDHRDVALSHGATINVVFAVPALPPGQARSYLLRSTGWYRVDTPETGAPDVASLTGLGRDSLAVGRASVLRLNAALTLLAEQAR
jgi:hypothetical protein